LSSAETLRAQPLMRPGALIYLYRRRLRVHAVQELLAGLGVAIGVALVFATLTASAGVAGSAGALVHDVVGPANLQLRARGPGGMPEALLARVERTPGVRQAAPLLEQTATLTGRGGRRVTVDLAGADTSLVVLDGLAHTLPTATLSAGGIGLSRASAQALGIGSAGAGAPVAAALAGRRVPLHVSAVLGPEAFGALSQALVAVMPLAQLQRLAGLPGRVSRILVRSARGEDGTVRARLQSLAGGRAGVTSAASDVSLARQALRPSEQASGFFAAVSALLGLLLAAGAMLLTVPERRRAVADLRLIGTKRSAIAQMFLFQALCLGTIASAVGLLAGYALSHGAFQLSTAYLAEGFTLGTRTTLGAKPVVLALLGGVLATCIASAAPLLDLRRGRALDAIYRSEGVPGNALTGAVRRPLGLAAAGLLIGASALFALAPSLALAACVALALATVLAVAPVLGLVLGGAHALAARHRRMTVLPVALRSLRATTLRSLALAATGAVALFGSVALGGARGDLLRGIERFAHSYSADAAIWVGAPGDNQAVVPFRAPHLASRIAALPGVLAVRAFQGGFVELDGRRVWAIARPPGGASNLLATQVRQGDAALANRRLGEGGWIALSRQIAEVRHAHVGQTVTLPTPSGPARLRVAATITNLAWSPGALVIGAGDYRRLWHSALPTALAVALTPGASVAAVRRELGGALGPHSGLQAISAREREASIDALTGEGLGQLSEISTLLLIAAILAMATALTSAIWQRRQALAGLRLSGVRPRRLRLVLASESALMLGAGCLTGTLTGVYGQLVIDGYLRRVTGFPVASFGTGPRPLAILLAVLAIVAAIVAIPTYLASRVSPRLAFYE
jgi:putative ABC transport system permease protein